MLKLSVIIPVYNIERYISKCIDSIFCQSYDNFEIILVDDGSTDSSYGIIEKYKDDSRVIVVHKQNGGLSSARNEGLKYVTGDYIVFIDGDDWIEKSLFSQVIEVIKKHKNVDIVTFSYFNWYSDDYKEYCGYNVEQNRVLKGRDFFEISTFQIQAWNKIYRTQFLLSSGILFLEGRFHEDISFTIPVIFEAAKIVNINNPLYFYRQNRETSIMQQIGEKNVCDFIHALCFDYNLISSKNNMTVALEKYLKHAFYYACLSHRTSYYVLRKNMKKNNVPQIIQQFSICGFWEKQDFFFYLKLLYTHITVKTKYLLGMIVHVKRTRGRHGR